MNLNARTEQMLRAALSRAAAIEITISDGGATKGGVIFRSLQEALIVLSRMPMKDGPPGYKSFWPGLQQTPDERLESYRQLVFGVLAGHISEDELITPAPVSTGDQAMMDAVLDVFPKLTVGRKAERDWRIVSLLAAGFTAHQVAHKIGEKHLTRQATLDRRNVQCAAIGKRLGHLMPPGIISGVPI